MDWLNLYAMAASEENAAGGRVVTAEEQERLMDALKAAGTDRLDICVNTASSPCIITAADGSEKFTYMILPVRLRSGE